MQALEFIDFGGIFKQIFVKDPLVALCKGKVSSQQLEELKASACDEKILLQKFYTGTLRIGISQDNLYWSECATIFAETPNKIEKLRNDVAEAKLFIQKKKDELNKIENRRRQLNEELDKLTNQLHSKLKSLEGLEMVTASLQEKTKKVANLEKNLVNDMQVQLVKDINKFSSLREESKFPKLSLVFNAMGISTNTIYALQDFTGVRFNYEDFNDCINHYGIINFKEQKDLCYIRHMMQHKFLSTNHVENCVVCTCKTPFEFKIMLKEREIRLSMGFDFLEKFHLNGPRFLFFNYSDSTNLFKLNRDQTEQLMNLKEQLLSLHLYDEIIYDKPIAFAPRAFFHNPYEVNQRIGAYGVKNVVPILKITETKPCSAIRVTTMVDKQFVVEIGIKNEGNVDLPNDLFVQDNGFNCRGNVPALKVGQSHTIRFMDKVPENPATYKYLYEIIRQSTNERLISFAPVILIVKPQEVDKTELSPDEIDNLVQMGFSEAQAVTALREHGFEKALEVLLDSSFN